MSPLYSLFLTSLLFIFLLILVSLYFWRKYSPLFKLSNAVWIDRQLIQRALFGDGKEKVSFRRYIFQKLCDFTKKNEKEGMCVFWIAGPVVFVYGEEATKFFSNEPSLFDKPILYKPFKFMEVDGIFTSNGMLWKTQRKLMKPAFYPRTLKYNIVQVVNDHAVLMVEHLAHLKGEVTDQVREIMENTAIRIFLESTLGVKPDTSENKYRAKRLTEMVPSIMEFMSYRMTNPWLYLDFAMKFSSRAKKFFAMREEFYSITDQILNEIKESMVSSNNNTEKNHSEDSDDSCVPHLKTLGEILIKKHLEDPSFTIQHVKVQLITIIVAGFDTVANSLTWIVWLLGLHQEVQERALEEIKAVTCGDAVNYEETYQMSYLDCVIKESLRLFPVGLSFARRLNKDIQFGKYTLPKNTTIAFWPWLLHRNPDIYPDPETFCPERFADADSKIKPWTHIPFAEGVRSCIGKNYAMVEMKIILSHVLKNFKIVSPGRMEDVVPVYEIMLRSETPLRAQFIPR